MNKEKFVTREKNKCLFLGSVFHFYATSAERINTSFVWLLGNSEIDVAFAEKIIFVNGNHELQQLCQYFAFGVISQKQGVSRRLRRAILPGRVRRDAEASSAGRPAHPSAALAVSNPRRLGHSPPVGYIHSASVIIPVNLVCFSRGSMAMEGPGRHIWGAWHSGATLAGLHLRGPRAQPSEVPRPSWWSGSCQPPASFGPWRGLVLQGLALVCLFSRLLDLRFHFCGYAAFTFLLDVCWEKI